MISRCYNMQMRVPASFISRFYNVEMRISRFYNVQMRWPGSRRTRGSQTWRTLIGQTAPLGHII